MENFNLSDFVMDFEFDFQNDFTTTENQVIDEILTNEIETGGIFDGVRENPSSFEYFYDDPGAVNGFGTAERLPQQQMLAIENGVNQAGFNHGNFSTASYEIEASVDEHFVDGIDFDWTTFLEDKSPGQLNTAIEQSMVDQQNQAVQDDLLGSANVINDNGFIYQELKTLDVPQIYGNLGKTFGLDDLKKLDKCVDFASLTTSKHPIQQDNNDDIDGDDETMIDHRNDPLAKTKVFLMPLQMDPQSAESIQNVATKLKKYPEVLNSMLNKCGKSKNAEKLELPGKAKHIKQQSEQYHELEAKTTISPMIKPSTERRQRKDIFKIEKVPIQYALQIVLNDINKSGIFTSKETVTEKPTKAKKQMSKSKPTKKPLENIKAAEEPKKNRRTSKKIKI